MSGWDPGVRVGPQCPDGTQVSRWDLGVLMGPRCLGGTWASGWVRRPGQLGGTLVS